MLGETSTPQIYRSYHHNGRKKRGIKSLLTKMNKKSEKADLKLSIQKIKIMAPGSITSWKMDGETMETDRPSFLGLQNH